MLFFILSAATFIILWHVPVKIRFIFSLKNELFELFVPLPFEKKLDLAKKNRKEQSPELKTLNYALKKLRIARLRFVVVIGTGDAFYDVIITQAIRSVFASVVSPYREKLKKADFLISVTPDFEKSAFEAEAECIFSLSIGNIISAILMELFSRKKHISGRRKDKTDATTDTGNNGNNSP